MERVFVQAALNGSRTPAAHERLLLAPEAIGRDAEACAAAGATAVHVHPRDADGAETLEPSVVAVVCDEVRARVSIPIGLTTELSIAGDAARRLQLVRAWTTLPDLVSVNVSEEGWHGSCSTAASGSRRGSGRSTTSAGSPAPGSART